VTDDRALSKNIDEVLADVVGYLRVVDEYDDLTDVASGRKPVRETSRTRVSGESFDD
jgi:hypothetical protein